MYLLVTKRKSKVWAVAEWRPPKDGEVTCPAEADDCFIMHGFNVQVMWTRWADSVRQQKNFAGNLPEFQVFTDSVETVKADRDRRWAKRLMEMWDGDKDRIAREYPELMQYV